MPMRKGNKEKKVYFSPAEWEAVERRAAALGLRTGTYIRRIATYGEIKNYNFEKYDDLQIAVNAIGTNVNQIAKVANSTDSVFKKDVDDLKLQMDDLRNLMNVYFSELEYDLVD